MPGTAVSQDVARAAPTTKESPMHAPTTTITCRLRRDGVMPTAAAGPRRTRGPAQQMGLAT